MGSYCSRNANIIADSPKSPRKKVKSISLETSKEQLSKTNSNSIIDKSIKFDSNIINPNTDTIDPINQTEDEYDIIGDSILNDMCPSDDEDSDEIKIIDYEVVTTPKTRKNMQLYWEEHSKSSISNSLMLLMEDNPRFELIERNEILSYLPNYKNMSIIELGAGIGRFTGELAKGGANKILAIDFMKKFLNENNRIYGKKYPFINYKCQDVTKLILPNLSYNFVFSNWLMMYLDDNEVNKLAEKMYEWCKFNGFIFFRESCEGGASGDKPRTTNPTYYRKHEFYTNLFDNISNKVNKKNFQKSKLIRISVNKIRVYIEHKNKTNQYCWLYQKIPIPLN